MHEKITDNKGKEIYFHRPNGDKLREKVQFTVKMKGKEGLMSPQHIRHVKEPVYKS